ncbi:MAG: hypothetical protein H0W10_08565 [Chloroflexi bacterium]|nr:hypothetical protein [Chloroflexota bacterium]
MGARVAAIMAVICVGGAAACAAAVPPSSAPLVSEPSTEATPAVTDPAPTPVPSARPRQDLGAELDVRAMKHDQTGDVLEFASDATGIIFSSNLAEDSGPEAAPDVWRYVPGPSAKPELAWRNPNRDHSVVKLGGDAGMLAFVDIPLTGERAWDLWLLPKVGAEPVLLDTHPGDEDVSSLVPSFSVYQPMVAWTAFDRGPNGPVSQLLTAEAPDWTPQVILERQAWEAELWLPSLYGHMLVFTEVRYSADRSTDERSVHLLDLLDPTAEPRRLDISGRATMPLLAGNTVLWKEAEPGFNMFNWGRMFRYDLLSGQVSSVSVWPQEYVNYPSVGSRFVAWWGADGFSFGVFDLVRDRARLIERYSNASQANVLRPHVAGDLMVWEYVDSSKPETYRELRWASLPNPRDD